MIYHGFTGRAAASSHRTCCASASRSRAAPTSRCKFTQPTTADKVKAALAGLGMTEESVTTAGTDGKGFVIQTQTAFANDSAPVWNALNTVAPVDRAASQITSVGPSLGREYLTKAHLGARDRAEHPVHLHRVPLRLELHLRLGHGHRARARRGDDDRHLRAGRQARRRRVPRRRADGHRLLGHGYDRHPRPNTREHQAHGGRSLTTRSSTSRSSRR